MEQYKHMLQNKKTLMLQNQGHAGNTNVTDSGIQMLQNQKTQK